VKRIDYAFVNCYLYMLCSGKGTPYIFSYIFCKAVPIFMILAEIFPSYPVVL